MKLSWKTRDGRSGALTTEKRLFTIGSDAANDLAVPGAALAGQHVHLLVRGGRVQVGSVGAHPAAIDGVRGATDLTVGSRLTLGDLEVLLDEGPAGPASSAGARGRSRAERAVPAASMASPPEEVLARLEWFSRRLAEVAAPERLMDALLDLLVTALEAERGILVTAAPEGLAVAAARGVDAAGAEADLRSLPDKLISRVLSSGQPLVTMDVASEPELVGSSTVVRLGLRALLALPLAVGGQVEGVLVLASSRASSRFTVAALSEVSLYAAQASLLARQVRTMTRLTRDLERAEQAIAGFRLGGLPTAAESMTRVARLVERVSATDLSVLISGETGTGKEVVAREIHARHARPGAPFVAINCGAIPEALIESELFGHARGAFSGALTDRAGKVEAAAGGTLFLDEIGDMPLAAQVRLLRVLQERAVTRLGEVASRPVQFRLISATHRDLAKAVAEGAFRQDLTFRLREVEIALPPLRERIEDLLVLARHFLDESARQYGREGMTLGDAARHALLAHAWPGNVRELQARIKRAVVMADGSTIEPEHLDLGETAPPEGETLEAALARHRREIVTRALAAAGGNRKKAAAALGIDERTLYRYLASRE